MANAVVAVFDEFNEAQSTVNELLVAGFDRNEVKLSAEDEAAASARRDEPEQGGIKGFFQNLFGTQKKEDDGPYDEAQRHGTYVVTAIASTEERSEIASEVMSHHHPIDIDQRSTEWLGSQAESSPAATLTEQRSMPLDEEITLREERVVEEVRVGKEVTGDGYRQHWEQNYGSLGGSYDDYAPAYDYGSVASANELYRGLSFEQLEPQLKTDWEKKYPASAWARFKDSVRHAFSKRA